MKFSFLIRPLRPHLFLTLLLLLLLLSVLPYLRRTTIFYFVLFYIILLFLCCGSSSNHGLFYRLLLLPLPLPALTSFALSRSGPSLRDRNRSPPSIRPIYILSAAALRFWVKQAGKGSIGFLRVTLCPIQLRRVLLRSIGSRCFCSRQLSHRLRFRSNTLPLRLFG